MKQIYLSLLLCFLFGSIIFLLHPFISDAQKKVLSASTQVSLSDALYADLAVRGQLDNVSLVYTDGKSVDDVMIAETRHWLPASTVKLPVAMYAFKLIHDGKINLSDTVTIDAKNDVPTELVTEALPTLLVGDNVTVERLIRQMIIQSDNTAYNQLLDLFGRDNVTAYVQSLGMTETHIGSKLNLDDSQTQYEYDIPGYGINSITALDYAKAFTLIKNNQIPGAKDLFAILLDQQINNMIPLFLPKTVVCAHKTGDLDPLFHDGGICQDSKQSYILTIFTNAGDPNILAHLSEIAYTRNYQLVGKSVETPTESENISQPIDELVMNPPKTNVLGAATKINFPVPDITAADLGIKAADLSLVIPTNKLPHVTIPSDSPFHVLSNVWQLTKYVTALGPQGRIDVALQTAQLRLAEANDLESRGKSQQAQSIMQALQNGLTSLAKDPLVPSNATTQTTIQSISDTRFSLLGNELQQTTGNAKLALIKQIATQAKETITNIQSKVPEAVNATSPTNKPLIGTIVANTPTSITVQTAGGQQITVPTNTNAVTIQEKALINPSITPETSETPTVSIVPTGLISPTPTLLPTGTTVALVGSTVDNHFTPSLILTNVPKELAAPQPVTVAKVDTTHNTMIVEENGVYTQVDINRNTTIKGADTNIPLKSIQAGDVVVVHGAPLTQTQPTPSASPTSPSATNSPTKVTSTGQPSTTATPAVKTPTTGALVPSTTTTPNPFTKPLGTGSITPEASLRTSASPTKGVSLPSGNPSIKPSINTPTSAGVKQPVVAVPAKPSASPTTSAPKTLTVIQGTSIQVIEKKVDVPHTPQQAVSTSKPTTPQPQQSQPQQSAPAQPVPSSTSQTSGSNGKKK